MSERCNKIYIPFWFGVTFSDIHGFDLDSCRIFPWSYAVDMASKYTSCLNPVWIRAVVFGESGTWVIERFFNCNQAYMDYHSYFKLSCDTGPTFVRETPFPRLLLVAHFILFITPLQRRRCWVTTAACTWRSSCRSPCTRRPKTWRCASCLSERTACSWPPPPRSQRTPCDWSWTEAASSSPLTSVGPRDSLWMSPLTFPLPPSLSPHTHFVFQHCMPLYSE